MSDDEQLPEESSAEGLYLTALSEGVRTWTLERVVPEVWALLGELPDVRAEQPIDPDTEGIITAVIGLTTSKALELLANAGALNEADLLRLIRG